MIIKYREKPASIAQVEVLLERIPSRHKAVPLLKQQLQREQAGYQGEKQVDFYLREVPHRSFLFLHDLRLRTEVGTFFQIDTLVLTGKTAIILEVKNYAGPLLYDSRSRQIVRNQEVLPNPFLQMRRHQDHLQNLFETYSLPHIQMKAYTVLTNPYARLVIEPPDDKVSAQLLYPNELSSKIQSFSTSFPYNQELVAFGKKLAHMHEPLHLNIMEKMNIVSNDIRKGVRCSFCGEWALVRRHSKWQCPACGQLSKDGHLQALYEYGTLFGEQITTKQCMCFLKITSRFTAYRLLQPVSELEGNVHVLDMKKLKNALVDDRIAPLHV